MNRKRLWWFVRLALTGVIFWLLSRQIDFGAVSRNFAILDATVILLMLATAGVKFLLEYINWYWCLRIDPTFHPRHIDALRSHTIGMALRFVVPGGHGVWGKVFFIGDSKRMTALSVGVERFLMAWTTILFAAVAGQFYFTEIALWIRLSVLVFVLLLPLLAGLAWRHWKHQSALPVRYLKVLPRILLTRAVFISLTSFQYWLVLQKLGVISLLQSWMAVPLIQFSNIIPITYSGLGVREGFAMEILSHLGVTAEAAVATSLLVFLFNTALPALPGAILIAAHRAKSPEKS